MGGGGGGGAGNWGISRSKTQLINGGVGKGGSKTMHDSSVQAVTVKVAEQYIIT